MEDRRKLSMFLSLILRHKPEAAGISLDQYGWADVEALIQGVNRTGKWQLDRELLEQIVKEDPKQRYAYNQDHTKLRANQGHSIPVEVELTQSEPPAVLYHGTATRFLESIFAQGLNGQGRQYVHLSADMATAAAVGRRHGVPVVLQIDAGRMAQDGYEFYLSANGVWLCRQVPAEYLMF